MKKKTIILSLVVLIGLVLGTGIFKYFHREDNESEKLEGSYFRKMHGSIGMVDKESNFVRAELFSFNSNVDFLNDIDKLTFDNTDVSINEVSYEEQRREKDLVVYDVNFSVSIKDDGRYDVTTLNYQDGYNTRSYLLGKLSFICEYGNTIFLNHGCNSMTLDGKAEFTFLGENKEAFTIVDLKLAEENDINYTYKKNISYNPGEELLYPLHVEYSLNKGDLFVVQPIFEVKVEGDKKVHLFTPNILTYSDETLTYSQIKEYVQ